jgi:hypothetical protein
MSDMKTPFKDTKAGQWIKSNAPGIINVVEGFVPAPVKGGLDIIKNLVAGQPNISPEKLEAFSKMLDEHESELIADVASARDRETKINESANSSWLAKNTASLIALFVLGLAGTVFALAITKVISVRDNLTLMVITSLSNAVMIVLGYYFGSSKSSHEKDQAMADLIKQSN